MTMPEPPCQQAFDDYLAETVMPSEAVNYSQVCDVAHEAFCSGWEASKERRIAGSELYLAGEHAGAADERRRWASVLADHYLMGINCDPETRTDNPMCGCSRVHLGWHPSIGQARQAWIDHVAEVVARRAAADDLTRLGEELEDGDQ